MEVMHQHKYHSIVFIIIVIILFIFFPTNISVRFSFFFPDVIMKAHPNALLIKYS